MAIRSNSLQPLTNSYLDGILSGSTWGFESDRTIDISMSNYQSVYGSSYNSYIYDINLLYQALSTIALDLERFLNINIVINETVLADPEDSTADITVSSMYMDSPDANALGLDVNVLGVAEFPDANDYNDIFVYNPKVDILINEDQLLSSVLLPGRTGAYTLYHELGHALGLKHPFDGGEFDRPTFASLGISNYDLGIYSVMSYEDPSQYSVDGYGAPGTFMGLDILALQTLYGKNTTFNNTNTNYDLSSYQTVYGDVWLSLYDTGGVDTLSAASANEGWRFFLNEGIAFTHDSSSGAWLLSDESSLSSFLSQTELSYENVVGSNFDDDIFGNSLNNTLNGGLGADTMLGGAGNDTYYVNNEGDRVYETTTITSSVNATGTDLVNSSITFSLDTYSYVRFVENLTLTGSAAINGTGNSLNNILIGNAGTNVLSGGAGADTLLGGAGNDTYYIDNAGDKVYETTTISTTINAGGTDRVFSSVTVNMDSDAGIRYVENLTLTGTAAINGTGNALKNILTGNTGANTLNGGSDNDILYGATGTDTLIGGLGSDNLYGGSDTVRDVFDFNSITESKVGSTLRDKIYNFVTGKDDIDLSGIDANTKVSADQAFKFGGTTKIANGVWYEKSGADLLVHADINGDKVSDMDIQLVGLSKIVATDFVL
jgi:Ca2+-binding RTX toxin-like protein